MLLLDLALFIGNIRNSIFIWTALLVQLSKTSLSIQQVGRSANYLFQGPLFRRGLVTCDALLIFSHHQQDNLDRAMKRRLGSLNFSAALDRVSHRGLLYKLRV